MFFFGGAFCVLFLVARFSCVLKVFFKALPTWYEHLVYKRAFGPGLPSDSDAVSEVGWKQCILAMQVRPGLQPVGETLLGLAGAAHGLWPMGFRAEVCGLRWLGPQEVLKVDFRPSRPTRGKGFKVPGWGCYMISAEQLIEAPFLGPDSSSITSSWS